MKYETVERRGEDGGTRVSMEAGGGRIEGGEKETTKRDTGTGGETTEKFLLISELENDASSRTARIILSPTSGHRTIDFPTARKRGEEEEEEAAARN